VVGGHEYNKIYDVIPNDVCFVKNSNFETTNVIKSIYDGIQACVHDRVLIVYGDLVFPSKYFNDYLPVKSNIIVNTCNSMSDEEIGCTYNSNKLEYLMYGLTPKWSQIMFLANKELELAYNFCKNEQNHNKLGFEMINHIVDNKGTIEAHQNGHKIIDIDYIKDINKIKGII
jgi:choline kinase